MPEQEVATLAGGCFWCLEAVYQELNGVLKVESGYMGGRVSNPTYEQVCMGVSGHAEVVQVTFDPAVLSFANLLEVFFAIHDPTTLNRQGNDIGTQYRSAIFYHSEAQREAATKAVQSIPGAVTEVGPATTFYKAEDYHQEYFLNNPNQPYCAFVVSPKVSKFRKQFGKQLKQSA